MGVGREGIEEGDTGARRVDWDEKTCSRRGQGGDGEADTVTAPRQRMNMACKGVGVGTHTSPYRRRHRGGSRRWASMVAALQRGCRG